jgi:hypothetical protein
MHFLPFFFRTTQSRAENGQFWPAAGSGWWHSLEAANCACAWPGLLQWRPSLLVALATHGNRCLATVGEHGGAGEKRPPALRYAEDGGWRPPVGRVWWRTSLRSGHGGPCCDSADAASSGERLFLAETVVKWKKYEDDHKRKVVGSFEVLRSTPTWASGRSDTGCKYF